MAHGPLHPPVSPTNQALLLGKLSDILPARRQFHEKFVSQARYEHFSALRSTDEPCAPPENTPPCCSMEVAIPSSCEDCVQECEEGVCDVELTEQCTDQCVVVPCNVAHHGYTPRDPPDDIHAGFTPCEVASAAGCDLICTDGPDCDALDTIVSSLIISKFSVLSANHYDDRCDAVPNTTTSSPKRETMPPRRKAIFNGHP